MLSSICGMFLASTIALDGVSGSSLRAVASFDSNNVHVGDPMVLTVDFIGNADFASLHPPALSREVDRSQWRVDDTSAKTETYSNARRLVYRIRPLKDGVLTFPSLTFACADVSGDGQIVAKTGAIPVHVKRGARVAMLNLEDDDGSMPMPDGLLVDLSASPWRSGERLSDEDLFAWRKACASPTAKAFARFDFPEAKLNAAACEILEGNWAKALRAYSRLEWSIGQTEQVERGIVAALALRNSNPSQELPMWRRVLRPVLRFAWVGRVLSLLALVAVVALVLYALRRAVRALALVAIALAVPAADAQSLIDFEEIERRMMRGHEEILRMRKEMDAMMGGGLGGGMSMTINGRKVEPPKVSVTVKPDKTSITVGDTFNFIVSLDAPKSCTLSLSSFTPSVMGGFSMEGRADNLPDARSSNTNNVVRRVSIPVRYDAPFSGRVTFDVGGSYDMVIRSSGRGRSFTQSFSSDFSAKSTPIWMEVKPLPSDKKPADYTGCVGSSFSVSQKAERYVVETNDVVVVTVRVNYEGYVPDGAVPGEVERGRNYVVAKRYFVADGSPAVDSVKISYYDTKQRRFASVSSGEMPLRYTSHAEDVAETVMVDKGGEKQKGDLVPLRFAPSASARTVAMLDAASGKLRVTEESGRWVRVDDGRHAGWVLKEEVR